MNKYWPYFIAIGAVVFVGLVILGYNSSRQIPVTPKVSDTARETPTQTASQQNISPTDTSTSATIAPAGLSLAITQPINGAQFTTARIIVSGKTAPRAEVFVNDLELSANSTGNFSTSLTLDEGENTILVVANDEQGNSNEKEITVTYNPK